MTNEHGNVAGGQGLEPGDMIGKYEVREKLGIGGQSIVYKCYDALLDRFVAIKHLSTHLTQDEGYLQRLRDNIRQLAKLGAQDEAIVTIYDIIEEPRGLFYVMEFAEGHTLQTLIREADGPIEPKAVLMILFRLAAALHTVHNAGIVHRDIKPSNIILTEGLHPKIIDFGVAAIAGGDASMPLATTKYLAPEIYSGSNVDGRADLYSLGFIAYEMLLGKEKFDEVFADIVRDKHSESLRWMKWHGNESVSAPQVHELLPSFPLSLSNLVARMMQKDPAQRFASAEDMGRAIRGAFSTKARASKGQAVAPSKPTKGRAGAMISSLAEKGIGSLDDDLDIPASPEAAGPAKQPAIEFDETPTAPLPKEPMSKRTRKMLLAAAVVVVIMMIGGVGLLVHQARQERRSQMQTAKDIYRQAEEAFNNEQYAQGLAGFDKLLKSYASTTRGRMATVRAPMCRAHLAISDRKWKEAQLHEADAQAAAEKIQEATSNEKMTKWTRRCIEDIDKLRRYRYSSQVFHDAVTKAEGDLTASLKESDFAMVLRNLEDSLADDGVNLTRQQEATLADLKRRVIRGRFLFVFGTLLKQGDSQIAERKYADAKAAYDKAQSMLSGSDAAAKLLTADQRKSLETQVAGKLRSLGLQQDQGQAFAAIRKAEQAGDAAALQVALQDALKLQGITAKQRSELQDKLKDIKARADISKARSLLADGNVAGARDALNRVLKNFPSNNEAKTMLANIEQAARKAEIVRKGNKAFAARQFDDALELYNQAGKYGMDQELQARIVDCNFNIAIIKAGKLGRANKYDEAFKVYNEAKLIKPASAAQVDAMILLLKTQQQYLGFISRGDVAMKNKKWDEAVKLYNEAKKIQPSVEVDKRIQLTLYQKNLMLGKEALAEDDLPRARFYFKLARKQQKTAEVEKLLKQAGGGKDDGE